MAGVRLEHVDKRFGDTLALSDLSLQVRDHEHLVLVGPSGCGKSTALRLIAGLEDATNGDVFIGDRHVNDVPPKDRDVAMVFQSYALYPHMTVYDNMSFALKLRKSSKQDVDRRVRETADALGLQQLLDRKPKELSGGQRQRVALGRAIVREPQVFLMDEPLSNLDAQLRVQTRAELIKLHHRLQTTTVYVTHDQVEAMTMGDRIGVLRDGVLQQLDTPQTLYDHPTNMFVAGFLGSPAMNFLPVQVTAEPSAQGSRKLWFRGEDGLRIPVPEALEARLAREMGRDLVLGIRPEHIRRVDHASAAPQGTLRVSVSVVEPLGSYVHAFFTTGTHEYVAVIPVEQRPRLGDTMTLLLQLEKAHLFDRETQQRLD